MTEMFSTYRMRPEIGPEVKSNILATSSPISLTASDVVLTTDDTPPATERKIFSPVSMAVSKMSAISLATPRTKFPPPSSLRSWIFWKSLSLSAIASRSVLLRGCAVAVVRILSLKASICGREM